MPTQSTVPDACHACGQWLLPRIPGVRPPLEVRLWRNIDRRGPDECWPWMAGLDAGGYGQINDGKGRIRKAHQIVLEIVLVRPLKPGEWGLHHCDYRPCCNPRHLYVGTVKDNVRDMWTRGRGHRLGPRPGEANHNAVLTETQIIEILDVLRSNPPRGTQASLARKYRVNPSVIMRIKQGRIWRHVTAPDP